MLFGKAAHWRFPLTCRSLTGQFLTPGTLRPAKKWKVSLQRFPIGLFELCPVCGADKYS